MNAKVLQRFVKDCNIPITVLEEPYFTYFVKLYDKDYGSLVKFQMLEETVRKAGSEEAFLEEYVKAKDAAITQTEALPEYAAFLQQDMNMYAVETPRIPNLSGTDIYVMPNDGHRFISIDMRKANFQVLRRFSKALVFGADTYEEYIRRFTDMPYIAQSKYTRQVIFGNMCPKRQVAMERYCMRRVFDFLRDEKGVPDSAFAVFTNDEIVLRADEFPFPCESGEEPRSLQALEQEIRKTMDIDISAKYFLLKSIGGKPYFVKEYGDGTRDFKNIPKDIFAQVYKKYYGMEVLPQDMVFFYNGKLAAFLEGEFEE